MSAEKQVNAWLLLAEDEPPNAAYSDPSSSYQCLIRNNVYRSVDVLFLCFANTVPTSATTIPPGDGSSYTLEIDPASHPDGLTNEDYLELVVRDARANNPSIRIAVTLDYNTLAQTATPTTLSQIFSNESAPAEENAAAFAANLMAWLQHYDLDGFDIDWESPLSDFTTAQQFALVINAIGEQFAQQSRPYLLTISPAVPTNLDPQAVNDHVSFVNLQLYSGFTDPSEFTGINPQLFAYGAKFENGQQTADATFEDNTRKYQYPIYTCWRLNSSDFAFEQEQQVTLHGLVLGTSSTAAIASPS